MRYRFLLYCSAILPICFPFHVALAEDCTTVLPSSDCTLTEDTTAALTMDNAVALTVGGSVQLGHTIDGSTANVGTIYTAGTGVTVNQTAEIGGNAAIDSLSIGDGDTWNASADITTNNNGADANDVAVEGDIDLGTADGGETLNLNGGITVRAQIQGNVADNVNVGADLNGGNFVLTGVMNTVNLSVDSGTLTTSSALGTTTALNSLAVASGATLTLGGSSNVVETLDLDGTLNVASGNVLTVNSYSASANAGTLNLGLDRNAGTTDSGTLSFAGGGPADLSGMTLGFTIEENSEILVSETISGVIQGDTGATVLPTLVDNLFLYDFSLAQNGNDVDLVVSRKNITDAATTGNNGALATRLLEDLDASESAEILAAQHNLMTASSSSEYNETLESMQPSQDAGTAQASAFVTDQTIDLALRRLMYLRTGNSFTGVSSGDGYGGNDPYGLKGRVWVQAFGSIGTQDARGGIDGYDLSSAGVSVGYDTGATNDKLVMGLSGTYADTQVDSNNANTTKTQMDSYQIGLYGTYNTDNDLFLNGALIWGINNMDSARHNVGGTGAVAFSNYDSQQITLYSDVGADYQRGNFIVTPSFGAKYAYLETEGYHETGAGGLNLTVNPASYNAFEVGPHLNMKWENTTLSGFFVIPEVSVGYAYDLLGDRTNNVVTLDGGGAQIDLQGMEPQRHIINLGTGLSVSDDVWELKANYDFEHQGGLNVHSASLRGVYKL